MFKAKLFNQFLATGWLFILLFSQLQASEKQALLGKIKLPKGFAISLFADNVPNARTMTLGDKGTIYVGHQCSLISSTLGTNLATSALIKLLNDFPVIIAF